MSNKEHNGNELAAILYGQPKKKCKKRFKRKSKDSEIRPEMNWKNRKTKSQNSDCNT